MVINIKKIVVTLIMFVVGLIFLLPFLWMISASFKVEGDVFKYPIQWIPTNWNIIENYKEVWFGDNPFYVYYLNSIKVTVITTVVSIIVSSMAAYGFAKISFRGSGIFFLLILGTYMLPDQAMLVPQFIMFRYMGFYDTHMALILLGSFSVLGTFLLRQFFMGVDNDYMEAAKIDGAGHIRIFVQIALPLVRPAIATYAILRFIWTWNDYQNPLIFLQSDAIFTVQLGMNKFADANGSYYSLIMAAAVSAIVPLLIVFIVGQKHVIEGISLGGVKG